MIIYEMKSYTDLSQSRKLVEILPIETADMKFPYFGNGQYGTTALFGEPIEFSGGKDIRCWSLTALFNYLRKVDLFPKIDVDELEVTMSIKYYDNEDAELLNLAAIHNIEVKAESFIDTCYELILKLYKSNLL